MQDSSPWCKVLRLLVSPPHTLCCDGRWSHQLWYWPACPVHLPFPPWCVLCSFSSGTHHPGASLYPEQLFQSDAGVYTSCRQLRPFHRAMR